MPVFVWKHGVTANEARHVIQGSLSGAGVGHHVKWEGNHLSATVGWGLILKVVGELTDQVIRLDQVTGAMASAVLAKSRIELASLFPAGYELTQTDGAVAERPV